MAEPAAQTVPEPAAQPAAEPVARPAAESAAQPAAQPAGGARAPPAPQAAQPVAQPGAEPGATRLKPGERLIAKGLKPQVPVKVPDDGKLHLCKKCDLEQLLGELQQTQNKVADAIENMGGKYILESIPPEIGCAACCGPGGKRNNMFGPCGPNSCTKDGCIGSKHPCGWLPPHNAQQHEVEMNRYPAHRQPRM